MENNFKHSARYEFLTSQAIKNAERKCKLSPAWAGQGHTTPWEPTQRMLSSTLKSRIHPVV